MCRQAANLAATPRPHRAHPTGDVPRSPPLRAPSAARCPCQAPPDRSGRRALPGEPAGSARTPPCPIRAVAAGLLIALVDIGAGIGAGIGVGAAMLPSTDQVQRASAEGDRHRPPHARPPAGRADPGAGRERRAGPSHRGSPRPGRAGRGHGRGGGPPSEWRSSPWPPDAERDRAAHRHGTRDVTCSTMRSGALVAPASQGEVHDHHR